MIIMLFSSNKVCHGRRRSFGPPTSLEEEEEEEKEEEEEEGAEPRHYLVNLFFSPPFLGGKWLHGENTSSLFPSPNFQKKVPPSSLLLPPLVITLKQRVEEGAKKPPKSAGINYTYGKTA